MKKTALILFIVFLAMILTAKPAQARVYQAQPDIYVAGGSATLKNRLPAIDPREKRLGQFLGSYGSPLVPYVSNFIEAADKYQIDWKLVPAITGVESSFGKQIPPGSHNAYGWNNGSYRFKSWEESIEHVTQYLKEKYIDRGLDTPYKIGPIYAPPSQTWAGKVVNFMNQIECYGQESCLENLALTL